jgi:hypothetical protein
VLWKEWNDNTKEWIEDNLKESASRYADHAENRLSQLQQAYSRKYQSQKCAYSANVSQRPQDVLSKWFWSSLSTPIRSWREPQQEPEPAKAIPSEEGITDVSHGLSLGEPTLCISVRR